MAYLRYKNLQQVKEPKGILMLGRNEDIDEILKFRQQQNLQNQIEDHEASRLKGAHRGLSQSAVFPGEEEKYQHGGDYGKFYFENLKSFPHPPSAKPRVYNSNNHYNNYNQNVQYNNERLPPISRNKQASYYRQNAHPISANYPNKQLSLPAIKHRHQAIPNNRSGQQPTFQSNPQAQESFRQELDHYHHYHQPQMNPPQRESFIEQQQTSSRPEPSQNLFDSQVMPPETLIPAPPVVEESNPETSSARLNSAAIRASIDAYQNEYSERAAAADAQNYHPSEAQNFNQEYQEPLQNVQNVHNVASNGYIQSSEEAPPISNQPQSTEERRPVSNGQNLDILNNFKPSHRIPSHYEEVGEDTPVTQNRAYGMLRAGSAKPKVFDLVGKIAEQKLRAQARAQKIQEERINHPEVLEPIRRIVADNQDRISCDNYGKIQRKDQMFSRKGHVKVQEDHIQFGNQPPINVSKLLKMAEEKKKTEAQVEAAAQSAQTALANKKMTQGTSEHNPLSKYFPNPNTENPDSQRVENGASKSQPNNLPELSSSKMEELSRAQQAVLMKQQMAHNLKGYDCWLASKFSYLRNRDRCSGDHVKI